jgi:conjugal transfer pilus assembly protein TraL
MSAELSHYLPLRLDEPSKFLFWSRDVAMIGLSGMLMGIAFDMPVIGISLGIAAAFGFSRLKSGHHPGMAAHMLYWLGFMSPKGLPDSFLRELNG